MTSMDNPKGRWGDLQSRTASAVVMVLVGGAAVIWGGLPFAALVVVSSGLMLWELARMTAPGRPWINAAVGGLGAVVLAVLVMALELPRDFLVAVPLLALAPVAGLQGERGDRGIFLAYGLALMLAGAGLLSLRATGGAATILWLVLVVGASDVMGYFAGRSLGGPKFWPAVSPKKTWSGTVAGWLGAAIVGLGFVLITGAGWGLIILSPVIALAGQLGDIVESWIKRRSGVKDSSSLIPGHGGVLDRFDALAGAVLAVLVLGLLVDLPLPEMGN
ncbi:phosphatidate cytidylyltransferase [Cereibacter ovatus]|uniref:Phosphatidate cytidylyltransferase n=1 Tax=Cereibacter ovatus TaxID=439529 RepID=A0A285CKW1_9RHOB|nr:phosphatidate cytidylyltransferase [Cereibacter ovatus]SNX67666.1 phosphatidate cytidylyltransferase [Cereibacter ovatus]